MKLEEFEKLIESVKGMESIPDSLVINPELPLSHYLKYVELAGHPVVITQGDKTFTITLEPT